MKTDAKLEAGKLVKGAGKTAAFRLQNAGVRYRLLTERQRTLKGRFLDLFSSNAPAGMDFWGIRNVNLQADEGDVIGIVGRNGSGKSTLLRLIAGVVDPSEGSVEVQGEVRPLLDLGGTLNGELSGRDNCYLYGAIHRVSRAEMDGLIERIQDFSELGSFFELPVKCYSSGMMCRLAFSIATQLRPEILLIDEVLSVGDEHFQKKSHLRMLKLIDRGSLVLMVSHDLRFLEQVCTKCVLVAGNRVVAEGAPRHIIADYRRQFS